MGVSGQIDLLSGIHSTDILCRLLLATETYVESMMIQGWSFLSLGDGTFTFENNERRESRRRFVQAQGNGPRACFLCPCLYAPTREVITFASPRPVRIFSFIHQKVAAFLPSPPPCLPSIVRPPVQPRSFYFS